MHSWMNATADKISMFVLQVQAESSSTSTLTQFQIQSDILSLMEWKSTYIKTVDVELKT